MHTVAAGSDSGVTAVQWLYIASAMAIGGLLVFRLTLRQASPAKRRESQPKVPSGERAA